MGTGQTPLPHIIGGAGGCPTRSLLFITSRIFLKKSFAKQMSDFPRRIPKDKLESDTDL
jgi:hypothetical protein